MTYRLLDVDVTRPLPEAVLRLLVEPVAMVLRDDGRAVGLLLEGPSPGARPDVELRSSITRAAGEALLAERLRRGLLSRQRAGDRVTEPAQLPPAVTVAVCTRNRHQDLERCLDRISAAAAAYPGRADILVVDNAPPDDSTYAVVARFDGVRYEREPVPGLNVARNRALAATTTEWLAFVDDDVRVDGGWLNGLATAVAEHPSAVAVTGLVLPAELLTEAQERFESRGGFGRGFRQQRWDGRRGPGGRLHPIGAGVFGAGCNMAFRAGTMRSLGGFDDALDTGPPLPGGGDLDAFYKVLAGGHTLVYEPSMTVFHRHRRGMDELRRQYYSWGTGFAAYLGARWQDRDERSLVARMVAWWLKYQVRQSWEALRRGDVIETRMVLTELCGGLAGSAGGYRRSRRRMARRRLICGDSP